MYQTISENAKPKIPLAVKILVPIFIAVAVAAIWVIKNSNNGNNCNNGTTSIENESTAYSDTSILYKQWQTICSLYPK